MVPPIYTVESRMTQVLFDPANSDIAMVKLAREIAMDIQPLEIILKQYAISDETWTQLQSNTKFQMLLGTEVEAWQTALNTHERVKMKSAAMLEEWLPDLNMRMHDHEEALPAVIEAGKMLARIAGLGMPGDVTAGNVGERFVINISMGPQAEPVSFAKDITSQVTIEHEPSRAGSASEWGKEK
jgi:hypothetical protein